MLSVTDCEREIRQLHDFFVGYYTGTREDFERVEAALDPDFELIHPSGEITDRKAVLDGIDSTAGSYDPGAFEIEIRNVEPVEVCDRRALVRYEEWQTTPEETTGRLSTAYFSPAETSVATAQWHYLQETWLEPEA
jgi:hypothetical protein